MNNNWWIIFGMLAGIILIWASSVVGQGSITFYDDTISLATCTKVQNDMGTIGAINHANSEIRLRWKTENLKFPTTGNTALIIDPKQFLPNSNSGFVNIHPGDSTTVLFYIWLDTMSQGDTALFQIRVWDEQDSVQTSTLLTAFLYCGLVSGNTESGLLPLTIYPNPFHTFTTIEYPFDGREVEIVLYDFLGRPVKVLRDDSGRVEIEREGLADGIYILKVIVDNEVKQMGRVVISR